MPLDFRLSRVCQELVTVWRSSETIAGTGKPSITWAVSASGVSCHFNTRPSQFELQAAAESGVLDEGDNIFTLDKVTFPLDSDVHQGDVLKVTTGQALLSGGFWRIRGELQPRTWAANKQVFIAARLPSTPSGVS